MSNHASSSRPVPIPSGRLVRMGRMGSMTASVAGSMALNGLGQWARGQQPTARDLLLTPRNMRRVADQLATMRGAAMKIGQLMSMDTGDVLPAELSEIMARLRADADFMPPRQLRTVLDTAWGTGWRKGFARFDVRPLAAASIGQVHRAQLPDGRDLAIKVQYPGIARSIDSDVANVGRLIRLSGLMPAGLDLAPYLEEARKQLHEEADYNREARHLGQFGTLLQGLPEFAVPALHPNLSTPTVLAMSYLPGVDIENLAQASQGLRDEIGTRLMHLMLRELFTFGLMQTDPNFANYRFDPDQNRIVLLDFGATRTLPGPVRQHYRVLLQAGLDGTPASLERAALDMGVLPDATPEPQRAQILAMIGMVFDHIRATPVMDFGTATLAARMQEAAQDLSRDGYIPPPLPIDLLFIQRKITGMFLLATRLRARVAVQELIEKALTETTPDPT